MSETKESVKELIDKEKILNDIRKLDYSEDIQQNCKNIVEYFYENLNKEREISEIADNVKGIKCCLGYKLQSSIRESLRILYNEKLVKIINFNTGNKATSFQISISPLKGYLYTPDLNTDDFVTRHKFFNENHITFDRYLKFKTNKLQGYLMEKWSTALNYPSPYSIYYNKTELRKAFEEFEKKNIKIQKVEEKYIQDFFNKLPKDVSKKRKEVFSRYHFIIEFLERNLNKPYSATEIAEELNFAQGNISNDCRYLLKEGILKLIDVESTNEHRYLYQLKHSPIETVPIIDRFNENLGTVDEMLTLFFKGYSQQRTDYVRHKLMEENKPHGLKYDSNRGYYRVYHKGFVLDIIKKYSYEQPLLQNYNENLSKIATDSIKYLVKEAFRADCYDPNGNYLNAGVSIIKLLHENLNTPFTVKSICSKLGTNYAVTAASIRAFGKVKLVKIVGIQEKEVGTPSIQYQLKESPLKRYDIISQSNKMFYTISDYAEIIGITDTNLRKYLEIDGKIQDYEYALQYGYCGRPCRVYHVYTLKNIVKKYNLGKGKQKDTEEIQKVYDEKELQEPEENTKELPEQPNEFKELKELLAKSQEQVTENQKRMNELKEQLKESQEQQQKQFDEIKELVEKNSGYIVPIQPPAYRESTLKEKIKKFFSKFKSKANMKSIPDEVNF